MGQIGQIAVLLLASITILSATSNYSLWESRQACFVAGESKNSNLISMTKIHKRSTCNLQRDFDCLHHPLFSCNLFVIPIQSLSQRATILVPFPPNSNSGKIIYQFEQEFQKNSKATHHYLSSYSILVIFVAIFLLFFIKDATRITIQPKDKFQNILLNLFILCFMIRGTYASCNPKCQTCSGSTCSLCIPGRIKSGNSCPPYTLITGCTWSNGLVCVSCANGYYLGSNTCVSCPSVLMGCLRCVGSPVLACNQCDFGYALNSTSYECDSCSFYLTSCVTCFTRYACTTCVNQTLTVNASGMCQLCSVKKIGCYRCNSSVCLQCSNGYYLLPVSFCTPCTTTLFACVICPNSTVCTQCISNAFILIDDVCINCGMIFPFCVRCTPLMCKSCDTGFFLNVNLKCECMKGILIDNLCVDVAGCQGAIRYQNSSFCSKCDPSIFYFNTTTVTCNCISGFLLNDQCSLLYGCVAMYYVNSQQVCAMCNRTRHFTKNQTWCICDIGYALDQNDKSCYEICGDGILFDLQCDDGNNIDFDGCSQFCTIQRGFKCLGGSANSSSKCLNALENFDLEVEEIENMGQYDTGEFQFNIINFHPYFYILDWSKIFFLDVQQSHNVTSISIRGSKLIFVVDYYEDLEGIPAILRLELIPEYFQYPKTINLTFSMISSTAPLMLASYPSAAILKILSLVLIGLSFLSLVILLFSPCYHKMIAVETFTILQLCNLAPYLVNGDSVVLRVFDNLSYVNGFGRQLFQSATAQEIYGETFEDMSFPKTFTQIMLINESLLFAVVLFFILAFWLRKFIFQFKMLKEKFRHFVYVYCCNLVFSITMSLYLIFCIALTCNNHRVYEKNYKGRPYESTQSYKFMNSFLNFSCILIGQIMIVLVGFFNLLAYSVSSELLQKSTNVIIQLLSKQGKRLNVKSKSYVAIYLTNLFICFSLLAGLFFFDSKYKVFIYLIASLPFAAFALIMRPYSSSADNFGICLGHIATLIFLIGLCVKQYFWIVKMPFSLYYQFYICMVVIALLVVFVITAIVRFFIACKFEHSRVQPTSILKEKKKKNYSRFRVENDDQSHLVDLSKPIYRLDPLKYQYFDHVDDNPDLLILKDKLRNDLYQKRNIHRNFNPFRETSSPILETWLSDDGDQQ